MMRLSQLTGSRSIFVVPLKLVPHAEPPTLSLCKAALVPSLVVSVMRLAVTDMLLSDTD